MKFCNTMSARRNGFYAGVLLGAALLAVTACSSGSTGDGAGESSSLPTTSLPASVAGGSPVKIGLITIEGGAAVSIPEIRGGAEAATQYVNSNAGGLAGHKVELVVCKEQEDSATATACANQMVEQNVAAVLYPSGGQGAVILPVVSGAKIPLIGLNGVSPAELTSPDSFQLGSGLPGVITGTSTYAAEKRMKNVVFVVANGGGTGAVVQGFAEPAFKAAGVAIKVIPIENGTADPTPQLTAGLAGNPDAVVPLGDTSLCISVIKAMQTIAPTQAKLLVPTCLDSNVVKAVGAAALKNSTAFTAVDANSSQPDSILYRSVLAKYAPTLSPSGFGSAGYQTMLGFVRATQGITGDVTAGSIAQALRSSKDVALPAGGGITFTCDGKAFAQLVSICSKQLLVGPVNEQGQPTGLELVGK